jgi:hypothetical protein
MLEALRTTFSFYLGKESFEEGLRGHVFLVNLYGSYALHCIDQFTGMSLT